MKVRIRNTTTRLVILALDRGSLHLGAGETSPAIDAAQLVGNRAVDKLMKSNAITIVPVQENVRVAPRKPTAAASPKPTGVKKPRRSSSAPPAKK